MNNTALLIQLKSFLIGLSTLIATISPTIVPATQTSQTNSGNPPNSATSSGTSRNWSGYSTTNGTFTAVSGTWTIPQVSGNGHTAADATWVGIGGIKSQDLIQAGTQNIVSANGQITVSAFYELLPDASTQIPIIVNTGDAVTVAITKQSGNQWEITFKDNSNGQTYSTTVSYISSLSSAEWIEEAPSDGLHELPLDNFGTMQFTGGQTIQNGTTVNLAQADAQAITMVNNFGQTLASPSAIGNDGASFSVTRSNAAALPIPQFDRNPHSFRRHGYGIGTVITVPARQSLLQNHFRIRRILPFSLRGR